MLDNPYLASSDRELIDALEGLADGEDDDMGLLLSAAARRIRLLHQAVNGSDA